MALEVLKGLKMTMSTRLLSNIQMSKEQTQHILLGRVTWSSTWKKMMLKVNLGNRKPVLHPMTCQRKRLSVLVKVKNHKM